MIFAIDKFLTEANKASENLFLFASFVNNTEFLMNYIERKYLKNIDIDKYKNCWNELEILNSLALSDWEDDGKPINWSKKWEKYYEKDAKDLISNLLNILHMN
ncbi:hypothetical protein AKG09_11310 [Neisseria sp. 83E34]|nr:hypothetical protein AKG09_11310 [Neisseria sp. 83E34]